MIDRRGRPPLWFWIASILLLLWAASGCYACVQQFRLGAAAMGPPSDYDRALFAALPVWYNAVFAVAVGTALFGAVALLARSLLARPLAAISLVAMIVMFGWIFTMTDLVAVKGVWEAMGFPAVIIALAVFQLWFAGLARRRGWIG